MVVTLSQILAALPALQSAERKKIRAAVDMLEKGTKASSSTEADTGQLLWEALISVGSDRQVMIPPYSRLQRTSYFKQYRADIEFVERFVIEQVRPENKTEHVQALQLAARALINRLVRLRQQVGLEITMKAIVGQVVALPAAVQAQWPGGPEQLQFLIRKENAAR